MTTQTKLYHRFRAIGETAAQAFRSASIVHAFEEAGEERVRIVAHEEQESYFDVYGEPDTEKERAAIVHQLELHGCCVVCAEVYNDHTGEWEHKDSIGMCVYSNPTSPFENCYVVDLMQSALSALPIEVTP